jgi:FtsH-binding integral membrane protein
VQEEGAREGAASVNGVSTGLCGLTLASMIPALLCLGMPGFVLYTVGGLAVVLIGLGVVVFLVARELREARSMMGV